MIGLRHGIDDKEREAEKEQGRRKQTRARARMCILVSVHVSLSFILFSRIHEYTSLYACMYVCMRARGRLHVCDGICINANANV